MKLYIIKRIKDGKYMMNNGNYTSDIYKAELLHSVPDELSQHERAVTVDAEIKELETPSYNFHNESIIQQKEW